MADFLDTREWFDANSVGPVTIALPEADEDYVYAGTRLFSWFPIVNENGALFEADDFDDETLQTLIGKQVNLEHDKGRVVGSLFSFEKNEHGLDVGVRIDRDQMDIHGMDADDLRQGSAFCSVSVELTKDPDDSIFYVLDGNNKVIERFSADSAKALGIRRTRPKDPFYYRGKRVGERIKAARFTGAAFTTNPADKSARLFAVRASEGLDDTPKETFMSEAQAKELNEKLAALEAEMAKLKAEKESASTEVSTLTSSIAELKAALAAKETELASVTTERDSLKSEKETAAREAGIVKILDELHAIHPFENDEERAASRETAAIAMDDNGVFHKLKLERTVKSLEAKLAEATKAVEKKVEDVVDPAKAAAETKDDKPEEKASVEKETFNAEIPADSIAPTFDADNKKKDVGFTGVW